MEKPPELLSYFNEENINLTWVKTSNLIVCISFG